VDEMLGGGVPRGDYDRLAGLRREVAEAESRLN
jgi:hypothetical protein